jgi:hypothetical protein
MQPARLAEHALDTSRRGGPAQVLPCHLGERREPLGAAGREIFWQVVIARLPPSELVQVHIADEWQRQVFLQIIEAAGCQVEYRQVPYTRR